MRTLLLAPLKSASNSWLFSLAVLFRVPELSFASSFLDAEMSLFMYNILVYWWIMIAYRNPGNAVMALNPKSNSRVLMPAA